MSGKTPAYTQHNCVRGSGLHKGPSWDAAGHGQCWLESWSTSNDTEVSQGICACTSFLLSFKEAVIWTGPDMMQEIKTLIQGWCHYWNSIWLLLTVITFDYFWLDLISTPISWRGSRSFLSWLSQRTKRSANSPKRGGKVWCLSAASTTCCCSVEERTLKEMLSSKMCTPFSRHSQELKQNVSCGNRICVEKGRGYIMEMNGIMHCLK